MRSYRTPVKMTQIKNIVTQANAGQKEEEWDCYYMAGGNIKWCNLSGEVWPFLEKWNRQLSRIPTIVLMGICFWEMKSYVHIKSCTQIFTATLFSRAENGTNIGEWQIPEQEYSDRKVQTFNMWNVINELPGITLNEKKPTTKITYSILFITYFWGDSGMRTV